MRFLLSPILSLAALAAGCYKISGDVTDQTVSPPIPGSLTLVTVWRIDPNMTLPRVYPASATLERQLRFGFMLVSDYTYQRGTHLLRARDIDARDKYRAGAREARSFSGDSLKGRL